MQIKKIFNKVMSKVYFAGLIALSLFQLHQIRINRVADVEKIQEPQPEKPAIQLTLDKMT